MKRIALVCFVGGWAMSLAAAWAAEQAQRPLTLSLPDATWSLEIGQKGFVMEDWEMAPGGDAVRLQASDPDAHVMLSAFIEKAAGPGGAKECRAYYWAKAQRSPFKKEQVKQYEVGDIAVVEYIVPDLLGDGQSQRNVNAYMAQGGHWVDVHLSKVESNGNGAEAIAAVVKSIRINAAYEPDAEACARFGMAFQENSQHLKAIQQLEKALALEKQKATLDRDLWKLAVDDLGIAYGMSGNLAKARETFEWAVRQEPSYPLFYYNLACAHAEAGNMDGAIGNLRLAYKNRRNLLKGQTFPDPRTDSSFRKYMGNPKFAAELEKMIREASTQPAR